MKLSSMCEQIVTIISNSMVESRYGVAYQYIIVAHLLRPQTGVVSLRQGSTCVIDVTSY